MYLSHHVPTRAFTKIYCSTYKYATEGAIRNLTKLDSHAVLFLLLLSDSIVIGFGP